MEPAVNDAAMVIETKKYQEAGNATQTTLIYPHVAENINQHQEHNRITVYGQGSIFMYFTIMIHFCLQYDTCN